MTMLRTDYSKDAPLLDYEIDDFDTIDYEVNGEHPTGINKNRMRLPTRYDISRYYQRLKRDSKGKYFNPKTGEYETVTRNKGEYGKWKNKSAKDLIDFSDDFEWQITYNFPETRHNNVTPIGKIYGGENVSYRRLYLILCERFNNKEYFIDTYFNSVYPYTVKEEVDVALQTVKDELDMYKYDVVLEGAVLTKKGELNKRYRKRNAPYVQALQDYRKFADEWEDTKGDEIADLIAEDIKRCLESGQIPLNHNLSASTMYKRRQTGVPGGFEPDSVFFAMGDLIDHIQLYVKIRR